MKFTYSNIERAAGIFVIVGTLLALSTLAVQGIRQGWFEAKLTYSVELEQATDIRRGTKVEIAGLEVGEVQKVELTSAHRVRIDFNIRRKYGAQIREGTQTRVIRPFILGQKSLEVLPGLDSGNELPPGSILPATLGGDPLEILQGQALAQNVQNLTSLLKNLEGISKQANQKGQLGQIVSNLTSLSADLKRAMPYYTAHAEQMGSDLSGITKNLNSLTEQLNVVMPAVVKLAESAPETSKVLTESLRETSILVRAIQKNFFIRGRVEEVKKEDLDKMREPASQSP